MAEENPFKKKKSKPKQEVPPADYSFDPEPAKPQAEPEPAYAETADPDDNPFARKKSKPKSRQAAVRETQTHAVEPSGTTRPGEVSVAVDESAEAAGGDEAATGGAASAKAESEQDDNPFAKFRRNKNDNHAVADSSSSRPQRGRSGGSKGGCSCWECMGFRGAFDSKVPPEDYKPSCTPNKNPSAALKAWLAEERKRAVFSALFVLIPVIAAWGILLYMIMSGDAALFNASLIVPRNSSVTPLNVFLNPFITNPHVWWNQLVDTSGFVAIGWMLVYVIGPHRIQLAILIYVILVPLCSLLAIGIELDVQAPVYGNQSVMFGFLGVIFAYVIVIAEERCKKLTIMLVMTGVYFGAYIGVRFALGSESDPVQWLTPVVSVRDPFGIAQSCPLFGLFGSSRNDYVWSNANL